MLLVSTFPRCPTAGSGRTDASLSNVYITGLDEATNILFFGWAKNAAGQRKLGDASATTVQNIPDSPDISLNDVSFTSMTVHMETVYAEDKNVTGFDVSWNRDGAMDSSDASNVYTRDWTKPQHTFFGWARIPQESAKTRRMPVRPPYRIFPMLRYFAQRRVFTSMTVHMEQSTPPTRMGFDVSWIPHDGAMELGCLECVHHGWTKLQHILSLVGERMQQEQKLGDVSATTVQNIPMLPIFRSTTCLSLP
jgi:hypothetical protein